MTFSQQIIATFVGSLAGFIFAILLFYLTEHIKSRRQKSKSIAGLKKEFAYNFLLIDKWIDETEQILRKVASGDHDIFILYRLTDYQRLFTQLCFQQGILYDALDSKAIAELNSILIHFDMGTTQWLNGFINQWHENKLPSVEANRVFEFERGELKKYKEQLGNMLKGMK